MVAVRSRDYGRDVLAAAARPQRPQLPQVAAERGLVVEDAAGRFCGAVVLCEKDAVTLEDRHGNRRVFPLGQAAFLLEGEPVVLVRPISPSTRLARGMLLPGRSANSESHNASTRAVNAVAAMD